MGGTVYDNCNNFVLDVSKFSIKEKVWILAEYIPGSKNSIDDFMSRLFKFQISIELKITCA